MRQALHTLGVETSGRGLWPITAEVDDWLKSLECRDGLVTVFIRHTSASLLVQENADPDVRADLETFFSALVRDGDPRFRHQAEGPDDMPAHVRAALTQTSLTLPVRRGALDLGTWQGVYVFEHRHRAQRRLISLTYQGE